MGKYDWKEIIDDLTLMIKIRSTPVGMKWVKTEEELLSISKVRVFDKHMPPCVIVSQAAMFNWTSACKCENFHTNYCRGIHGMFERDDKWFSGSMFENVWFDNLEAAREHQAALNCVPDKYYAIVASPLISNRIDPDVCVLYVTPSQAFMILAALQYKDYKKLEFSFVGESTCSDSWINTLLNGKPGLALPCYADRKFAGVSEEHVRLTFVQEDLVSAVDGLKFLSKNGLRYPIASYSLTTDILEGLPESYLEY